MPTESEIIPSLKLYPNDQPIAPSLLDQLPETVILVLESVRIERRASFVYSIDARILYVVYPVADQIACMEVHFVPDGEAATELFEAFGKAQASKRHGPLLREDMLVAHEKVTGLLADN